MSQANRFVSLHCPVLQCYSKRSVAIKYITPACTDGLDKVTHVMHVHVMSYLEHTVVIPSQLHGHLSGPGQQMCYKKKVICLLAIIIDSKE